MHGAYYEIRAATCEEAGIGFQPVIFETTGGLELESQTVLESLLVEVARHKRETKIKTK